VNYSYQKLPKTCNYMVFSQ